MALFSFIDPPPYSSPRRGREWLPPFRQGALMRRLVPFTVLALLLPALPGFAARATSGNKAWCGTEAHGAQSAVWAHREQIGRRGERARAATAAAAYDVGQIAVLLDEGGDLALLANPMNLQKTGLRFTPSGSGYSVSRVDMPLEPDAGSPLSLTDDSTMTVPLSFAFPFYGQ